MQDLPHQGVALGHIHKRNNDKKYFCHFTGFLEGIAASGFLEPDEIEPLIAESIEFVQANSDGDAIDIIGDYSADLLEFGTITGAIEVRSEAIDSACKKSQLNRFLGYCRGIVCDGIITLHEAIGVLKILNLNADLLEVVGVRQIQITCMDAVADGILSPEESQEICEAIEHVVGDCYGDTGLAQTTGVANFAETRLKSLDGEFVDSKIVLTGSFKTSPRKHLEDELAALGAEICRSVSGKTDYLLIGGEASRDWIELNRGTKIRKAQQLRVSSEKPHFLSEAQLLRLMAKN